MKNISLIFILVLLTCKKNSTSLELSEKKVKNDTIISNIKYSCEDNIPKNIYNYLLCKSWSKWEEKNIRYILHFAKENKAPETIHLIEPEIPSWVYSDIKINGIDYDLKINGMSYLYLINKKNKNNKLLTFNSNDIPKIEKYFIRKLTEDDDENYENRLNQIKNDVKKVKTDASKWLGTYTFENNNYDQLYKKYTLNIKNNEIYLYEGELPDCKIYCIPYIVNNEMYLYYNSEKTNCPDLDTSLIDHLQDGDLFLKIYLKNGKKYIQSPVIQYWNDKSSDFKKNISIEIN